MSEGLTQLPYKEVGGAIMMWQTLNKGLRYLTEVNVSQAGAGMVSVKIGGMKVSEIGETSNSDSINHLFPPPSLTTGWI